MDHNDLPQQLLILELALEGLDARDNILLKILEDHYATIKLEESEPPFEFVFFKEGLVDLNQLSCQIVGNVLNLLIANKILFRGQDVDFPVLDIHGHEEEHLVGDWLAHHLPPISCVLVPYA